MFSLTADNQEDARLLDVKNDKEISLAVVTLSNCDGKALKFYAQLALFQFFRGAWAHKMVDRIN
jgi:hypothetical protein